MIFQKIASLIAKSYIIYCQRTPNHRGKQKIAFFLDAIFGSFICKTASGQSLEVYLHSSMDMSYFQKDVNHNDSHEEIIREINKLALGDFFIDVGANIGFFTLLASKKIGLSGRAFAFEPSPREYKRLINNIELNSAENILPYNIAISDYNGECKFFISSSGHTGINSLQGDMNSCCPKLVPILTGDTLLSQLANINPDSKILVKIDVEGAEFSVILGMKKILSQSNVKTVILEITPKFLQKFGHKKEDIYSLMNSHGFFPTVNSIEWQYDEIFTRTN